MRERTQTVPACPECARFREAIRAFLDLAYFDVPNAYAIPPLMAVEWARPGTPIGDSLQNLWTAAREVRP